MKETLMWLAIVLYKNLDFSHAKFLFDIEQICCIKKYQNLYVSILINLVSSTAIKCL